MTNTSHSSSLTLGQDFWNSRWKNNETGWDIGFPSPAITDFFAQFENKNAAILIPGCGNAYEAEYLVQNGFTNITLIDIAPKAVENIQNKFQNSPQVKVICGDFFAHTGKYDIIIEQTFFCAIPPEMRELYVQKTHELLHEGGTIVGVLFNKDFGNPHPPFGGSIAEYQRRFSEKFDILKLEACRNSIPPRAGTEVFIRFRNKS